MIAAMTSATTRAETSARTRARTEAMAHVMPEPPTRALTPNPMPPAPRRRAPSPPAALRTAVRALAFLAVFAPFVLLGAGASARAGSVRRIVSLNPSLTAIVVRLGAADRLVGIDDYSARILPELAD